VGVGTFAAVVGLDRQRGFYPTILLLVASEYVVFAILASAFGDSVHQKQPPANTAPTRSPGACAEAGAAAPNSDTREATKLNIMLFLP
jgi:hypothetical protein